MGVFSTLKTGRCRAGVAQVTMARPAAFNAFDEAMKLGVNYPAGPFAWMRDIGAAPVVALHDALDAHYRGERYRASRWLRRQASRSPA